MPDSISNNIDFDLDYFSLLLRNYFFQNMIEFNEVAIELIEVNSDNAYNVYSEAVKNGNSIGAMEIAMNTLFANVGIPEFFIVSELLVDEFKDNLPLDSSIEIEFTTQYIIDSIPDLFEGIDKETVGISRNNLEDTKNILIGRISSFLN